MERELYDAERHLLHELGEDECHKFLFETRFGQGSTCGSCGKVTRWSKLSKVRAYSCQYCGHHLHPTAGTVLAGTKVPLRYWLFAVYRQKTCSTGVTTRELRRQLGLTCFTARRVATLVRANVSPGTAADCPQRLRPSELLASLVAAKPEAPATADLRGVPQRTLTRAVSAVCLFTPGAWLLPDWFDLLQAL